MRMDDCYGGFNLHLIVSIVNHMLAVLSLENQNRPSVSNVGRTHNSVGSVHFSI